MFYMYNIKIINAKGIREEGQYHMLSFLFKAK